MKASPNLRWMEMRTRIDNEFLTNFLGPNARWFPHYSTKEVSTAIIHILKKSIVTYILSALLPSLYRFQWLSLKLILIFDSSRLVANQWYTSQFALLFNSQLLCDKDSYDFEGVFRKGRSSEIDWNSNTARRFFISRY